MLVFFLWSFVFLGLAPRSAFSTVLAIDYGTEWIKASLIKPGVPFDVLLNKDSKRKVGAAVGWKQSDRLFGTEAANMATRYPSDIFTSVKVLQGAPYDSEPVSFYGKITQSDLSESTRGTVAVRQSDGSEWSTEELIAMQLAYIKQLADSVAEESVRDVIFTVPPFYSQYERDSVADAIEIAGLRTLALINDGTAVAVNYAMTRTFSTQEYHIIYDAGASSIVATLASFVPADPKNPAAGTSIAIVGVGYDRKTGGLELDKRMRQILIENFNAKSPRDIREDKKGMAKLWKEAGRVKAILSANTEAVSSVENVAWDIDFRTKITRAQFESACGDLRTRFVQPIYDALNEAQLSLANVTSVLLVGGATRTPMIQAAVKGAVGANKIALNVNADEAAVLGAAFHGASLSRQYKTKNIKVTDIGVYNIEASYLASSGSSPSRPRTITSLVFPAGSKVGTKKTMTFKRREDFSVHLDYKHLIAPGFPQHILEADISGVADAIRNLTEAGAVDPVIKATLMLSESGFVSVAEAVAQGTLKDGTFKGKLKEFFGGPNSADEETTDIESTSGVAPLESQSFTLSSSTSLASSPAEPSSTGKVTKKPKDVEKRDTIFLKVETRFPVNPPMTVEEKKKARSRLRVLDMDEAAKTRKDEARNNLEGYMYRMREYLENDDREAPFQKCSTEYERKIISRKLDETFTWLHERGDLAETSQLLDKRISLEALEKPIIHRYQERETFPQALNNSQMWNWSTRLFLAEARQNMTTEIDAGIESRWTAEELDSLEKTLKDHEKWLAEWAEKQKSVKAHEDPVIETAEMKARAKVLETSLKKLYKRKDPKFKKPKVTSSASTEPTPSEAGDASDDKERQYVPDEQEQPVETPKHDEL